MGSSAGIYRATYRDRSGEQREASTWIATYWDRATGKQVKEYGFPSASAARRRRAEIMAGPRGSRGADLTLDSIINMVLADYEMHGRRSIRAARSKADLLRASMGAERAVRDITTEAITEHIRRLQAQGYRPATINRTLALLKRGLRLAHRTHPGVVVPYIPMLSEADNARQGFFDAAVLEEIIAHLSPAAVPIVRVLHVTGWRVSEIVSRRWLDIEGGQLLLRPGETKNGRGRAYPMEPDLSRIIGPRPKFAEDGDRIFGLTIPGLRAAWERARAAAGHPTRLLHDLRRTAARDLILSGVDRDTARRILGHETDSIFSRYRIVSGDDLAQAASRLSAFRRGPDSDRTRIDPPAQSADMSARDAMPTVENAQVRRIGKARKRP